MGTSPPAFRFGLLPPYFRNIAKTVEGFEIGAKVSVDARVADLGLYSFEYADCRCTGAGLVSQAITLDTSMHRRTQAQAASSGCERFSGVTLLAVAYVRPALHHLYMLCRTTITRVISCGGQLADSATGLGGKS